VTVNLSARQFLDPGLVPTIKRLLRESALPSQYLILEITESVALIDIDETMIVLEHLGNLGVGVALDDFGTGFSSLSYLARLNHGSSRSTSRSCVRWTSVCATTRCSRRSSRWARNST